MLRLATAIYATIVFVIWLIDEKHRIKDTNHYFLLCPNLVYDSIFLNHLFHVYKFDTVIVELSHSLQFWSFIFCNAYMIFVYGLLSFK